MRILSDKAFRRALASALLIAMLGTGLTAPALTAPTTVYADAQKATVEVTADSVNVRADAGSSASKVGTAVKGRTYTYLGQKKASNGNIWYKIQLNPTKVGYIYSGYGKIIPAATGSTTASSNAPAQSTTASGKKQVRVKADSVNVRSGAGSSNSLVGHAVKDRLYDYLGQKKASNGVIWYKIQYTSSKVGYIASGYGEIVLPTTTAAAKQVLVTAASVTVHSGSGTYYSKVGTATKGQAYPWLNTKTLSSGKTWYRIQYSASKLGWISADYCTLQSGTGTTAAEPAPTSATQSTATTKATGSTATTASSATTTSTTTTTAPKEFKPYFTRTITGTGTARIYNTNSTKGTQIGILYKNHKYTVTGWKEGNDDTTWYSFDYNGKTGWVSRKYVKVSDEYRAFPNRDFSKEGTPFIYLSPSKQPDNAYAGYKTSEQDQMYRVAAELQKILENEYVCNVYTAPTTVPLALNGRALDAHNRGADVYLAIHSNADGASRVNYGAIGFYCAACPQSETLAKNIISEMGKIAIKKTTAKPNLVNGMVAFDGTGYSDIRDPSYYGMISVLAEVEFHDNKDSAKWIINHPTDIARALANSLESTIHMRKKGSATPTAGSSTTSTTATTASGTSSTSATSATSTTTAATVKKVQITRNKVNLRSGAGTNYSKVATVSSGSTYTYLASKTVSGKVWYKLQYSSSKTAWVTGQYSKVITVTETPSTTAKSTTTTAKTTTSTTKAAAKKVKITAQTVNVRSGAGTSYTKLGKTSTGKTYTYLGSKKVSGKTWYKIQYTSSKVGWVTSDYAKLV